jgi:L-aspartate oxidase
MEFVQFHPTAIDIAADPLPLATEALRGEGALLIDRSGTRFMPALDPRAELAPRDIVARGVFAEIAAGRGAFLDATSLGTHLADKFPGFHATCRDAGFDPATQPIPVAPAAHWNMGGIAVDRHGRTSLKGLWAGGEVSSTGAHGANRLASNSLLEAVVYATRIADDINGQTIMRAPVAAPSQVRPNAVMPPLREANLRAMMSSHVGVVRDGDRLAEAIRTFAVIEQTTGNIALRNMATTALIVAASAWSRRESRGAHFRSDCPQENPAMRQRTMTTLAEARDIAAALDNAPSFKKHSMGA